MRVLSNALGYQATDVTWETRGEVGYRVKGPPDWMRSRGITRDLGEFGAKQNTKGHWTGVAKLWKLGKWT